MEPPDETATRGLRFSAGFIDLAACPAIEPVPGCRMRTPFGRNLMLSYLEMDAGAEVPLHSHPHEQGGVLLSGSLDLTIGGETRRVTPGSLFLIPPNVPHRAVAADGPAVVLNVFSPVRVDYAEMANRYIPVTGKARVAPPTVSGDGSV